MLKTAVLGLAFYGVYSIVVGLESLFTRTELEWWADLWVIAAGAVVLLSAAFVRVSMPGGLALAVGGLLGLQSISLHNDGHLYGQVLLLPQFVRAAFAAILVGLAYVGWGADGAAPPGQNPKP